MRIPIFTDEVADEGGWHGAQLKSAFKNRGVETVFVSLKDCIVDLSGEVPIIKIPDIGENSRIAFVRGI
nr:alpha-L-glutamate ligase [Methylotenera sp.]